AFDLNHFRPPVCAEEPNPVVRNTQLDAFEDAYRQERARLQGERLSAPIGGDRAEAIDSQIKGLDAIDVFGARKHIRMELALRERVVKAVAEYMKTNQAHFRTNSAPPPSTQKLPVGHEARNMVSVGGKGEIKGAILARDEESKMVDNQGRRVNSAENAQAERTLTVGSMDDIIREAIRDLPADVRADIEAQIGTFRFGADGRPLGGNEQLLGEAVLQAVQEGLADPNKDSHWDAIESAERGKETAVKRAAFRSQDATHIVGQKEMESYLKKVTEEVLARRFGANGDPGKDKSIADLFHDLNEARKDMAWNKRAFDQAKMALDNALSRSPEFKRAIIDSLKTSFDAKLAPGLEAALDRSTIKTDESLKPGETKVVLMDSKGVPFEPIGMDPKKGLLRKDGAPVQLSDVRIEINVSTQGSASTLVNDTLVANSQALLELTRPQRLTIVTGVNMTEMASRDVKAQANLAESVRQLDIQRMEPFFQTVRKVWSVDMKMTSAFPTTFDSLQAGDVTIAMEEAITQLEKAGTVDAKTLDMYRDYARKYQQEALSEDSSRALSESFHKFFESQRIKGTAQDGLWQPPDTVPKSEKDAMEAVLKKFGANRLADPAVRDVLIDALLQQTKSWENLKPLAERSAALDADISRARATAFQIAKIEAQKALGKNA
ncbi:MAG: hypothetical protein K2Z81_03075, partial [Cyanobacteria bacterium]|nr:hypothetical protein [Cyanobacteriota bacterium]